LSLQALPKIHYTIKKAGYTSENANKAGISPVIIEILTNMIFTFGGMIMEDVLRPLFEQCASKSTTLGIIMAEKEDRLLTAPDMFDVMVIVVEIWQDQQETVRHLSYREKKIAFYIVNDKQLQEWVLAGSQPKLISMLLEGEILFDRNRFMETLQEELRTSMMEKRKMAIGLEFAKLIANHAEGKAFFKRKQYLHAYYCAVYSLYHMGNLVLLENGRQHEPSVWFRIRQIEPEILKIFEELVLGNESIDKRLELLYLVSEFLIYSKTPVGTEHVMEIIREKPLWKYEEISRHPEMKHYGANLSPLLHYLVERKFLIEIKMETNLSGIYERLYQSG
jgi:hypothetical protein